MILELNDVLKDWAEETILMIKDNMVKYDINASGETSNSLEYVINDDGVTILGADYFSEKTEIGRSPSKNKSNFDFNSIIQKWIKDKNLLNYFGISNDRELKSVSFAIVRNITKLGSSKYRGSRPKTDVFSSVLDKQSEKLIKDIDAKLFEGDIIDKIFNDV